MTRINRVSTTTDTLTTVTMAANNNAISPGFSKNDLINSLSKCQKCYDLTDGGSNIISYKELNHTMLNNVKKRQCYIINTESMNFTPGHWFLLAIYTDSQKRIAILADGLDIVASKFNVMTIIKRFCRRNNLTLTTIKTRYQKLNSKKCGLLSLYFVCRVSFFTCHVFLNFDSEMKSNSITSTERLLLKKVKTHFRL